MNEGQKQLIDGIKEHGVFKEKTMYCDDTGEEKTIQICEVEV